MSDLFFPPLELQETNHCGPASLSMCLGILGEFADQRKLAKAAGKPFRIYLPGEVGGLDEHDLRKAANVFKAKSEFVIEGEKSRGRAFLARLTKHLDAGNPLLLMISDFGHWIAVVGRHGDKFVVFDPIDDEHAFNRWSGRTLLANAWNESDEADGALDQYFAILTSRRDGKPALFAMTPAFARLCERGSEDTAGAMISDLSEMAARAAGGQRPGPRDELLGDVLSALKQTIVGSVWHWIDTDSCEASRADLERLYDDYVIVASATGVRLPKGADTTELVAQITAVLTTYAWCGEL